MTNMYRLRSPLVTEQKYALILSLSTHTHTYISLDVRELGCINLPHIPRHHLGHRVKGVFPLAWSQGHIQNSLGEWDLHHHILHLAQRTLP